MPLFRRSGSTTPAGKPTGSGLRGGVDLGGTKIQALIVDADSKVLGRARAATPHEGGPPAVIGPSGSPDSDRCPRRMPAT